MCDCSDEVNLSSIPVGPPGPQGPPGAGPVLGGTSTTIDINATPIGGLAYQIPLVDNTFVVDGMVLFVEDAGYYEVINSGGGLPPNNITVTDLAYTGNNPANLLATKEVTAAGLQGDAGTNGTDGFNYETTDGNNIPAEASGPYEFIMRNSGDTGYTFVSLAELKILLNSIP